MTAFLVLVAARIVFLILALFVIVIGARLILEEVLHSIQLGADVVRTQKKRSVR